MIFIYIASVNEITNIRYELELYFFANEAIFLFVGRSRSAASAVYSVFVDSCCCSLPKLEQIFKILWIARRVEQVVPFLVLHLCNLSDVDLGC